MFSEEVLWLHHTLKTLTILIIGGVKDEILLYNVFADVKKTLHVMALP